MLDLSLYSMAIRHIHMCLYFKAANKMFPMKFVPTSQQFCNYSEQFCFSKLQSSDTISVIFQQLQHNLLA